MRLPAFDYFAPDSLDDALKVMAERGSAAVLQAGGTDLIPRLRQRLVRPDLVVSLKNLGQLKGIVREGLTLRIGALTPLKEVMEHDEVKNEIPGLAEALASVGSPHIQHRAGAIGGNLLLGTRCLQYNQSEWWRSGRDHCHKDGGQVCHVLPDSKECSASCQSDGAVMLTALGAQAVLRSVSGERVIKISELFSGLGDAPFTLAPEEILTEIRIFLPAPGTGTSYRKLRWRSSIDYPLISAGALVTLSKGRFDRVRLVLGAAGPAPLLVGEAEKALRGRPPEAEAINEAADLARKKAEGSIVENTVAPAEYRRRMVAVLARRALSAAVEQAS